MLFDDNLGFISYNLYNNMSDNNTKNVELANIEDGFFKGNMFKNEYKPYKNYEYRKVMAKNEREALLLDIMELAFAINDLNLYLDLHPSDSKMLEKFNELVEKSCKYEMEYVKNYGSLEVIDNTSKEKFEWISNPWPWDNDGGTKYV